MHTPALPLGSPVSALQAIPVTRAVRTIPEVWQPTFGLQTTAVIPGSVPVPNAFYDPALEYSIGLPYVQPPVNMPANQYLPYLPGLARAPQP